MSSSAVVLDSNVVLEPGSDRILPAEGRIPGNPAIWAAILSEMSEFAVMFLVYFIAKIHNPEIFNSGPEQLNTLAGTLNTLLLISSSFFVAKAMAAMRNRRPDLSAQWMTMAVAAAWIYLLVKFWEYKWNVAHGIGIETNLFFATYYYMTFNHLLHVGWGSGALIWGIYRIRSGGYNPEQHQGLETIASYWHMIDLAWIVIFPLLYVLR